MKKGDSFFRTQCRFTNASTVYTSQMASVCKTDSIEPQSWRVATLGAVHAYFGIHYPTYRCSNVYVQLYGTWSTCCHVQYVEEWLRKSVLSGGSLRTHVAASRFACRPEQPTIRWINNVHFAAGPGRRVNKDATVIVVERRRIAVAFAWLNVNAKALFGCRISVIPRRDRDVGVFRFATPEMRITNAKTAVMAETATSCVCAYQGIRNWQLWNFDLTL